jgi:hypothetical protein
MFFAWREAVARFAGSIVVGHSIFMLSPAPQAEKSLTFILRNPCQLNRIMLLFNAWFFSPVSPASVVTD